MIALTILKRFATDGLRRLEDRAGLALIATLLVVALVAVLITTAMSGAMSSVRTSGTDTEDARVFYAAEAGGEATLAQLQLALRDGYLSDQELANIQPPVIEAISFDSFAVSKIDTAVVETITDGPYAGLYALTQNVDIYSRAANTKGDMSAVILRTKAQAIPIFQFGVWFEEDLEATNGPPMEFVGRVHSNGNIFLSSDNAWYREMITTPNQLYHDRKDFHDVEFGVFVNDAGGNEVVLDFDSRTHPDPDAFKSESSSKFDSRVQTDAFGVDSLRIPLPTGIPAHEVVRPRETTDGDAERQVKFAWNADMYVTVDLVNITTKEAACGNAPVVISPDVTNSSNITVTGEGTLCPGQTVTFTASHPALVCADFDSRALLTIDAGAWVTSGPMTSCVFTVTLPNGQNDFKIKIELKKDDYPGQLTEDGLADIVWLKESIEDNCDDLDGDDEDENKNATTSWPRLTVERPTGREVPSRADACKFFQWMWSEYYDGREDKLKDVLNVDIAQLNTWVGGNGGRIAEVIYVEFIAPIDIKGYAGLTRNLMPDASLDPAVRVINGAALPNPMTIATEWPIYVRGNYNSVAKQPAAVVGDGITILSNAWSDADNRPPLSTFTSCKGSITSGNPCNLFNTWAAGWANLNATETTVNGAVLAGNWATPCDHEDALCPADGTSASCYQDCYGGGLENYPRFLETWRDGGGNKVNFNYLGALIAPFSSKRTTGTWNGTYYDPPQRNWAFDTDFQNPKLLPPGTPNVGYVIRTAMREAF